MFERRKKKDVPKMQMITHVQKLTPLAEKNLLELIYKEEQKENGHKVGKSYMINKLLEEM